MRSPNLPDSQQVTRELNFAGDKQEGGRYRDSQVMGNFTPAPYSVNEKGHSLPSSRYALKQLLALLQE